MLAIIVKSTAARRPLVDWCDPGQWCCRDDEPAGGGAVNVFQMNPRWWVGFGVGVCARTESVVWVLPSFGEDPTLMMRDEKNPWT